ncbi:T9SS C-terminal target domain-containing protein [Marinilabiliaceae bacterium JC017]|nr:T9SS C-terminal target domain-containing protein [Marinilabiliaceae bacterium JC017]
MESKYAMRIRLFLMVTFLGFYCHVSAQNQGYKFPERTNQVEEKILAIPEWKIVTPKLKSEVTYIDNSTHKYFPPVFNQIGNSCSQASGIRYIFTYEINALRDIESSDSENLYNYHFTWNYLNDGEGYSSWYFDGFDIVKDCGVPNIVDMDDGYVSERTWMSGYDKYFRAMHNRIKSYSKITANTDEGLDKIKRYLTDHGNGSDVGGLIVFSGRTFNWKVGTYNGPSNTGVKYVVKKFGNDGDHAMTIVGFDDEVEIDVNEDGVITTDEIGALIGVNTWGTTWGDKGKFYFPYKTLKMDEWQGGIGNGDKNVYLIEVMEYKPKVTMKVVIDYSSRNDLSFKLGVSPHHTDNTPKYIFYPKFMKNQGGDFYMRGGDYSSHKTIELGFDITKLVENIPDAESPKFFFTVYKGLIGTAGNGKVKSLSVIDYREDVNQPKEYICKKEDVAIESRTEMFVTLPDVGIEDHILNEFDQSLKVFPNPATSKANITFNLSEGCQLKVDVIDPLGRSIQEIENNYYPAGNEHLIQWEIPRGLNQGIYFIRILLEDSEVVRKVFVQ